MDISEELNDTSYSETNISYEDHDFEDFEFDEEEIKRLTQQQPRDSFTLRNDRCTGFDNNTADSWIYPTNLPIRQYQYNIVSTALFKNTLVILPTGLGKTFIAAVLMYNIYRWYPTGKVIFMAPTRPLVNQQIEACYKIMGIPKEDTVELTGKQPKKSRADLWETKRVFYCTPQVVEKDLNDPEQRFPIKDVKLIVIDEAHKAKGRYAYVEVIKAIASRNTHFRILALTASPGNKTEEVIKMIENLLISHIEVRWENSPDVATFVQKKNIQSVTVQLGDRLSNILNRFNDITDPYIRKLCEFGVIRGNTANMTKGWLFKLQENYTTQAQKHPKHSEVIYNFHVARSLYHALELLNRHGIRVFLNYFDDNTNSTSEKFYVSKDQNLKSFLQDLRQEVGNNPYLVDITPLPDGEIPEIPKNLDFGHPKFIVLQKQLVDFFEKNNNSKVIVFCEFRDSVALVYRLLLQNRPLIKPKCIVGQGGGSNNSSMIAISQKEQMAIMKDFRSADGNCNTLISTCVIEEGIDIGEVDLILCFDVAKDMSRFVQRIGRTGRQRKGKVLVLVTEGREKNVLKDVLASKDKMPKMIASHCKEFEKFFHQSARLVPNEYNPKCVETFIKLPDPVPDELIVEPNNKRKNKNTEKDNPKQKRKKKNEEHVLGSQDVRKFFIRQPKDKQDQILEAINEGPVSRSILSQDESVNAILDILETKAAENDCIEENNVTLLEENNVTLLEETDYDYAALLDKQPTGKLLEVLTSEEILIENCPNIIKKMLLEKDVTFLKNSMNNIEQLEKLEVIFEGKENILKTIQQIEEKSKEKKNVQSESVKVPESFLSKFNEKFTKLKKFRSKNVKKQTVEPVKVEEPPEIIEPKIEEKSCSNIFDDFDGSSIWSENSKKYESPQFNVSMSKTPRLSISTPLNNKLKKFEFKESPIVRALQKKIEDEEASASMISEMDENVDISVALQFCGLKSIEELFQSSEEEDENVVVQSKPKNKFMEKLESINEMEDLPVMIETTEIQKDLNPIINDDAAGSIENSKEPSRFNHQQETGPNDAVNSKENEQNYDIIGNIEELQSGPNEVDKLNKNEDIEDHQKSDNDTASIEFTLSDDNTSKIQNLEEPKPETKPVELTTETDSSEFVKNTLSQEKKQEPIASSQNQINSQNSSELNHDVLNFGSLDDIFDDNSGDDDNKENVTIQNEEIIEENKPNSRRKLNFERLKAFGGSQKMLTVQKSENESPFFATCNTTADSQCCTQDETVMPIAVGRKTKTKNQIIESSDEDEVYATCPNENRSPQESEHEMEEEPRITRKKPKKRIKQRNSFLATQAGVSGNDDSEDDEDDLDMIDDSFVDHSGEDECHDHTAMQAKYLESIKSPVNRRGVFKIPELKTFKVPFADVFSQQVENHGQSNYYDDTFCVEGEDEVEYLSEVDELEQAEALLKERRRAKKLSKGEPKRKRRRIITDDDSD